MYRTPRPSNLRSISSGVEAWQSAFREQARGLASALIEREHVEEHLQPFAGCGGEHLGDLVGTGHLLSAEARQAGIVRGAHGDRRRTHHGLRLAPLRGRTPEAKLRLKPTSRGYGLEQTGLGITILPAASMVVLMIHRTARAALPSGGRLRREGRSSLGRDFDRHEEGSGKQVVLA